MTKSVAEYHAWVAAGEPEDRARQSPSDLWAMHAAWFVEAEAACPDQFSVDRKGVGLHPSASEV